MERGGLGRERRRDVAQDQSRHKEVTNTPEVGQDVDKGEVKLLLRLVARVEEHNGKVCGKLGDWNDRGRGVAWDLGESH